MHASVLFSSGTHCILSTYALIIYYVRMHVYIIYYYIWARAFSLYWTFRRVIILGPSKIQSPSILYSLSNIFNYSFSTSWRSTSANGIILGYQETILVHIVAHVSVSTMVNACHLIMVVSLPNLFATIVYLWHSKKPRRLPIPAANKL